MKENEKAVKAVIAMQVALIRSMFDKVERLSADNAEKLLALLDKAPPEALQMLVDQKVKFCHGPAARRLREKFGIS